MSGRPATLKAVEEFELRQFREAGMSIEHCASYFKVSRRTVMRVLEKQRRLFGQEKLPRRQSARSDMARGVIKVA